MCIHCSKVSRAAFCVECKAFAKDDLNKHKTQRTYRCFHCAKLEEVAELKKGQGICVDCRSLVAKTETKRSISPEESAVKKPRSRISQALRAAVWKKYASDILLSVPCYCCKSMTIDAFSFECGHVIPESQGGTINIDNLRPICVKCNRSMGTKNLDEFAIECGFRSNEQAIESIKDSPSILKEDSELSWSDSDPEMTDL